MDRTWAHFSSLSWSPCLHPLLHAEDALNPCLCNWLRYARAEFPRQSPEGCHSSPVSTWWRDIEPLTTRLWLCPSSQFVIHLIHPSIPCFSSLEIRMKKCIIPVRALTVVRSFSVRSLLHLNTVTEEAGRQVPVTTILQLLALFQRPVLWWYINHFEHSD